MVLCSISQPTKYSFKSVTHHSITQLCLLLSPYTAVLHMLFARFMQHFLASEGLVSHWEPFRRLVMMGMVMGTAYRVKDTGRYLSTNQVDFSGRSRGQLVQMNAWVFLLLGVYMCVYMCIYLVVVYGRE